MVCPLRFFFVIAFKDDVQSRCEQCEGYIALCSMFNLTKIFTFIEVRYVYIGFQLYCI